MSDKLSVRVEPLASGGWELHLLDDSEPVPTPDVEHGIRLKEFVTRTVFDGGDARAEASKMLEGERLARANLARPQFEVTE